MTARTDFATADATVTVLEGSTLPPGTVRWSSGKAEGCQTVKIIQAVPSANGPAIYQQSVCEDGEYVAAYTANGVQLWRRKISDNGTGGASSTSGNRHEVIGKRLDARAASFCDLVVVGMEQQKIHELLTERNLTSHQEGSEREWLVEEASAQCRVWFDERLVVVKKEKVFVAD